MPLVHKGSASANGLDVDLANYYDNLAGADVCTVNGISLDDYCFWRG